MKALWGGMSQSEKLLAGGLLLVVGVALWRAFRKTPSVVSPVVSGQAMLIDGVGGIVPVIDNLTSGEAVSTILAPVMP